MNTNLKASLLSLGFKPTALVLTVFLLGTAIFFPTLSYDFIWDDHHYVENNQQIKSFANGWRFLTSDLFLTRHTGFYRPTFMFSLTLDYALFKVKARGYHLTNILLHGINAALLTYLALLLLQSPYAALIAGALFALHPVHPEAVAFISARADLLFTFFSLLILLAVLKDPKKMGRLYYCLLIPFLFSLALLSKETAVVVFVFMALVLYQKTPQEPKRLPSVMIKILPSALILVLYLFLRHRVLSAVFKNQVSTSLASSPFFSFELFLRYLTFLIFPPQQASHFLYVPKPHPQPYPLDIKFWALAGLSIILLGLIVYIIYRRRETLFFFALLFLPILPTSYFNLLANFIMIDRYLYLPTAGLAILAGWCFLQIPDRRKFLVGLVLVLVLAMYGGATLWRTVIWKDDLTFFEALKKEYPHTPYVKSALGAAYKDRNRPEEAHREMAQAIALDPKDPGNHNDLGWFYLQQGSFKEAGEEFTGALKLFPNYAAALEGLGLIYWQAGQTDKALEYLDKAVLADPQNEAFLENKKLALAKIKAMKKQEKTSGL